MKFASHLRHRAGGCDTVVTISAVTDGKDAQEDVDRREGTYNNITR